MWMKTETAQKAGMWAHRFDDAHAGAGIGGEEAEDPWSCAVFHIALHIFGALRCIAALQALRLDVTNCVASARRGLAGL
jgi:hypothetical protein